MKTKSSFLICLLILSYYLYLPLNASGQWYRSLWGKHNPATSLIGFNSSIQPERGYGYLTEAAFTSGFGYRSLTPSALTSYKGILIGAGDNLQYTRGSLQGGDGSGVVYENANGNQIGIELWVRPHRNGNDGLTWQIFDLCYDANNRIQLYKNTSNNLILQFLGNGTSKTALVSISTWIAGTWYYVTAMADKNNIVDTGQYLQVRWNSTNASADGTTVPTALTSLPSTFQIGQDFNNTNQFNGIIVGQVTCLPLTTTEISNRYASGAGHTDTFTVTPNTIWHGLFSNSDTDSIFWHRGQQVTAITNGATESTLTLGQAVGSRSWADNDRVVIWDGTGYKKEGLIDEASIATTDTSLDVDNNGVLVTDIEKVGVYANCNGNQSFVKATPANLNWATHYTVSAWIRLPTNADVSGSPVIFRKDGPLSSGVILFINTSAVFASTLYNQAGSLYMSVGATKNLRDGKWHHVMAVYDNTAVTLTNYIDSYQDGQDTTASGVADTGVGDLGVGGTQTGGQRFPGNLRDVAVWQGTALTADDAVILATKPLDAENAGLSDATPDSWWKLVDAASVVNPIDSASAGNNNHLTLSGGTTTNYGTHSRTQQAFISKNLIADSGMEQGGIGNWSGKSSGENYSRNTSTISKDTSIVKFDTRSLKTLNNTANHSSHLSTQIKDVLSSGLFTGYVRPNGTIDNNLSLVSLGAWRRKNT